MMTYTLIFFIKLYQRTISPDHGTFKARHPYGYCRYYPTCSQYAIAALQRHGTAKGILMTLRRITRCNPWSAGGIDIP